MRALVLSALLLAGCAAPAPEDAPARADVFAGEYDTSGPWSRVLRPGALAILDEEVLALPSDLDGLRISLGLVRPATTEPVPVILHASPYFRPLVAGGFREQYSPGSDDRLVPFLVENFVPHGYAVALVPVRGTASSGGCYDLAGPDEAADLVQAVAWLASQPWSNGRVGMIGTSLAGVAQLEVAAAGAPALATIVTIGAEPDLYRWLVRNGTPALHAAGMAPALYAGYSYEPVENPLLGSERPHERIAESPSCPELAEASRSLGHVASTGERDPWGYVDARAFEEPILERYRGSVLLVHGFLDLTAPRHLAEPWGARLAEAGVEVKRLYGQWGHAPPDRAEFGASGRSDWAEILLRWFDRELEGADVDVGPPVQVADSAGRWRSEAAWPPADAVETTFSLGADGALAPGTSGAPGSVIVRPDPVRLLTHPDALPSRVPAQGALATPEGCPTCELFRTAPLAAELRFAGLPRLHLTATPHGASGHLTASLLVETDGALARLASAQMDLRFAGGDTPSPLAPGAPILAPMEFEPVDAVVPAGARLVVSLSQSGYGGGLIGPYRSSGATNPVEVALGGDASVLTLLVFERGEEAYFVPPAP